MADMIFDSLDIKAVADAIRRKNGKQDTYTITEMPGVIDTIKTGFEIPYEPVEYITVNSLVGGFFLEQKWEDIDEIEIEMASSSVLAPGTNYMFLIDKLYPDYKDTSLKGIYITCTDSGFTFTNGNATITPNLTISELGDTNRHTITISCPNNKTIEGTKIYLLGFSAWWSKPKMNIYHIVLKKNNNVVAEIKPCKIYGETLAFIDVINQRIYYSMDTNSFLPPAITQNLDISHLDGDKGNTNVIYSDVDSSTQEEELTPEEIAEIERIRRENGLGGGL